MGTGFELLNLLEDYLLLSGISLAALWLLVVVLAMGESALTFASRAKLEETIDDPQRRERYFRYLEAAGSSGALCVIGRILAVAAVIAILARNAAGRDNILLLHVGIGAAFVSLAELAGRFVGKKWATVVLIVLLPPLRLASFVTAPLHLFARSRGVGGGPVTPDEEVVDAAKEEIRVAIEDAASEGALHLDEKEMIEGVLEFRDSEVHGIMTPRMEMESVEVGTPMAEAIRMVQNFLHSRIPVYERVRDNVVGVVHVKDLLPLAASPGPQQPALRDVMREPFFVPETKGVRSLLREFRQRRAQIAVVLDEYGGVTGLVTLEDIMEEIVGEIEDEFDQEDHESRVVPVGPGAFDVDARLPVDEANELLKIALPEDDSYDTLGGFVMERFASVPRKGQELRYNGILIRVLDSDNQHVRRVLVKKPEPGIKDPG